MGLGQADGGGASPEVGTVGSDVWSVCRIGGVSVSRGAGGPGPSGTQEPGQLSHPPPLSPPREVRGWENCLGWEAQCRAPSSDVLGLVSVPCRFIPLPESLLSSGSLQKILSHIPLSFKQ